VILDAAQPLFERDGFAATSMPAIAVAANVASKTVYLGFGSKSGVLHALWDLRLGGDDEPVTVPERRWYLDLLDLPDPAGQLGALAAQSCAVKRRAGGVMRVVRDASTMDDDIAELWQRIQREFRDVLAPIAVHLEASDTLAAGLDATIATDILWTLSHPDPWNLLVNECGWPPERYESWLTDALCSQLLRSGAPPR
jgi:AcrR family transcriptional regulator